MATKRVRIYAVVVTQQTAIVEIPDWKRDVLFELAKSSIPFVERSVLHPGFTCMVDINPEAECAEQLAISNWNIW